MTLMRVAFGLVGVLAIVAGLTVACGSGPTREPEGPPPVQPTEGLATTGPTGTGQPAAPRPAGTPLPDLTGWQVGTGERGHFELAWRPVAGSVPRNTEFSIEVLILQDGQAQGSAHLRVRAWMPDHGHGVVREPIVTARGDGYHDVEGMLLHMRGRWEIFFDITSGTTTDTVRFELEL